LTRTGGQALWRLSLTCCAGGVLASARGIAGIFLSCVLARAEETDMESIPLALLLQTDRRGAGDIERTAEAATQLGLEVTGRGRASVTVRASPEVFAQLFGTSARKLPAESPGVRDSGRPAGYTAAGQLAVPPALAGFVAEITVSAPAHRL
jgi:hypothetical protein